MDEELYLSFILCYHLQLYVAHYELDQSFPRECQNVINFNKIERSVNFSNAIRSANENRNKNEKNGEHF